MPNSPYRYYRYRTILGIAIIFYVSILIGLVLPTQRFLVVLGEPIKHMEKNELQGLLHTINKA